MFVIIILILYLENNISIINLKIIEKFAKKNYFNKE